MKSVIAISSIFVTIILLTGCYTQVELPKHSPTQKLNKESERMVNFTYSVIDTFDNDWLPNEGYYYEFRFDLKKIKEDKIDLFLNMLYAKGYNVVGAWYRPAIYDCLDTSFTNFDPYRNILPTKFIILLSEFNDSIIEHNFYPVITKPEIICPYNVEEYWVD